MVGAINVQETSENCRGMSFNDRFERLVDRPTPRSHKLERLIKQASFTTVEPSITNIDYLPDRQLDQRLITRLATGSYIKEHHNIIIMGASGNGET